MLTWQNTLASGMRLPPFRSGFKKVATTPQPNIHSPTRGYVTVENRCNKGGINGKQSYIKGKAFVVENSGNAKLKVQFFWPFRAKYWIIDLADDYSYAVIGHPDRKYLWILSRTSTMDEIIYQQIISRIKEKGFDISKIKITNQ